MVNVEVPEKKVEPIINNNYQLPPITLLDNPKRDGKTNSTDFIRSNKTILERVLKEFGINGRVVEIHVGPSVTQYEINIAAGTKLSRIVSLDKEIALALAAKSIKIEAPIPNTWPSALYSIADAATPFANPVIGTRAPAPPQLAKDG